MPIKKPLNQQAERMAEPVILRKEKKMIVEHKKVADTAVEVIKIISNNDCNSKEAREVARTILSVTNSLKISAESVENAVYNELRRRYSDDDLTSSSSFF